MSDSDSDDSYFERMAAAAPSDEPSMAASDTAPPGLEPVEYSDDADYFDDVNRVSAERGGETIQPVESSVWRYVSKLAAAELDQSREQVRRMSQTLRRAQGTGEMTLLLDFLFTRLPGSSSLFSLLTNYVRGRHSEVHSHIWCDDMEDPSFVCCVREKSGGLSVCLESSEHPISREILTDLGGLLKDLHVKTGLKIGFMALDDRILEPMLEVFGGLGISKSWVEPASLFYYAGGVDLAGAEEANGGYTIRPLINADSARVNATWKYRGKDSEAMISSMITAQNLPSFGAVRAKEKELCAWLLTYPDASLGMMYTEEAHRRRGLGKAVAKAVLRSYLQQDFGLAPFCYIVTGNQESEMLYTRHLGFVNARATSWVGVELTTQ